MNKIFRENQRDIAEQWLDRGKIVNDKNDETIIFAKFFFYFTGFNAMYFLYKEIDKLDENFFHKKCPQYKQIEHLLDKFNETVAQKIIDKLEPSIDFFKTHPPIKQMKNVREMKISDEIGKEMREILSNSSSSAKEKIKAFGQIIYLVRCNLYHGSKEARAGDKKIVENCIEPLRVFLEKAIEYDKKI